MHIPQLPPETIDAAAAFLHVSPDTLRDWLASKLLDGALAGVFAIVAVATKSGLRRVGTVWRQIRPNSIAPVRAARSRRRARNNDNPKLPF